MAPAARAFGWLTGHAPALMALSVPVGLLLPTLAGAVRPGVVALASLCVMLAVVRVDPRRLGAALRRPGHILAVAAVVLLGLPAAVAALCLALGAPVWLTAGLALSAAAPPLSSAAAFAILVRIDAALVTAVSLPATLLAPATVWAVASALPGMEQAVDVSALTLRLAGVILGAFALAVLLRRVAGAAAVARAAPPLDAAIVICVVLVGVGVMHDVGLALRAEPVQWLGILAATWALSLGSCALTLALFWPAGRDRALAAALTAAIKNMAVMVAAVLGTVDPRIALVVITAQLPIYLAPLILRPLFARLGAGAEGGSA